MNVSNLNLDDGVQALFQQFIDKIDDLNTTVKQQEMKINNMSDKVNDLTDQVGSYTGKISIMEAKLHNSAVGREATLQHVPFLDGSLPTDHNLQFPHTILNLFFEENETLPNGVVNDWNDVKSLALLQRYIPDDTDEEGNPDEEVDPKRNALLLAQCIGITRAQVNLAQLYI